MQLHKTIFHFQLTVLECSWGFFISSFIIGKQEFLDNDRHR